MVRTFPDGPQEPPARPSICIVTSELVGPFNNGGIGTSMTGLAQRLAAAGFPVALLYTGGPWSTPRERAHWRALYERIGIDLEWLPREDAGGLAGPMAGCGFAVPWLVYRHLTGRRYDIVHFNDCMGEGFYCLAMKRLGAAFQETRLWVGLHSPSQWIYELNRVLPDTLLTSAFNFAERLSTRCADLLWSPSHYLLDWIDGHGFERPDATYVQQYVLPAPSMFEPGGELPEDPPRPSVRPTEIIFFGRLEERKGLRLFCAALTLLGGLLADRGIAVTFLGKPGAVGDMDGLDYLQAESAGWLFSWTVRSGLGQQEAVDYVRSRPALAVMASPADNSPCTVYEALAFGMPFIAARTGGIPELIAKADADRILFDYAPEALAAKIEAAVESGIAPARPAWDQETIRRRWIGAFAAPPDAPPRPAHAPARTVLAIVDHKAGDDLERTLGSLDRPEIPRILVVNRSGRKPDWAGRAQSVEEPDTLRRALVGGAEDAFFLIRSGAALCADALPGLLRALGSPDADGLMPAATLDDGRSVPPLGGSQSFCFYAGAAHAGALAVKPAPLLRVLADEQLAPASEYFGLADLAVAGGLALWPYPEPVIRLAEPPAPDRRSLRATGRVRAYGRASPTELYYMAAIAQAAFPSQPALDTRLKRLRERLYRARLGWAVRAAEAVVPRSVLARLRRAGRR
jgi:glycosyltransferase involved in cell wall biosynthesis